MIGFYLNNHILILRGKNDAHLMTSYYTQNCLPGDVFEFARNPRFLKMRVSCDVKRTFTDVGGVIMAMSTEFINSFTGGQLGDTQARMLPVFLPGMSLM